MKIGIDFGTTNSAVAVLDRDGAPRIVELAPGERVQRTVIHASLEGEVTYGNAAFRAYVESDLSGRFLRSLKAFLSQDVPRTTLAGRRYAFEELVAAYLRFLVQRTELVTGERVTEVVVGRPVHFNAEPERDATAARRLAAALADAGLPAVSMQLEPVAAAHLYERTLDRERVVLVGDFGGGTSDFAILRAGPDRARLTDRRADILATSGVAAAGDALDARFMDTFLMHRFGRGATIRKPAGQTKSFADDVEPWTHPVQQQIQRLYYLYLLRDGDLARRLDYVEPRISDPTVIRRIRRLVFDDLGYPMAWAIEASKRALADVPSTVFRFTDFHHEALDFEETVTATGFAEGSAALRAEWDAAVVLVLARAGLHEDDIDDVFLTGGTSQLPFVRGLFAQRFGSDRLRSADSFTSVCEGLALANHPGS